MAGDGVQRGGRHLRLPPGGLGLAATVIPGNDRIERLAGRVQGQAGFGKAGHGQAGDRPIRVAFLELAQAGGHGLPQRFRVVFAVAGRRMRDRRRPRGDAGDLPRIRIVGGRLDRGRAQVEPDEQRHFANIACNSAWSRA